MFFLNFNDDSNSIPISSYTCPFKPSIYILVLLLIGVAYAKGWGWVLHELYSSTLCGRLASLVISFFPCLVFLVFCLDWIKSFLWFWKGISVGKKRSNVIMSVCVCVHRHIKRKPLDIYFTLCFWCIWKKEHENLFFYVELHVVKLSDVFLKAWYLCSLDTHGEEMVSFMYFLNSVLWVKCRWWYYFLHAYSFCVLSLYFSAHVRWLFMYFFSSRVQPLGSGFSIFQK